MLAGAAPLGHVFANMPVPNRYRTVRMPRLAAVACALCTALAAIHAGARPPSDTVVVRRGDTLGKIAKRCGVSVIDLRRANGLKPGQRIVVHQRLTIPRHPIDDGAGDSPHYDAAAYVRRPAHPGYLELNGATAGWKGMARVDGAVPSDAQRGVDQVLAFWRDGESHSIDPRLIEHLSEVSDHFGGRAIRVVSGFRPETPTQYTPHSRHNQGEAVDFVVDGVPNEVVRDYCRTLGAVGVGYYPHSSFVHLDVRAVPAYWVDESGPGEAPRYSQRAKLDDASKSPKRGARHTPKRRAARRIAQPRAPQPPANRNDPVPSH